MGVTFKAYEAVVAKDADKAYDADIEVSLLIACDAEVAVEAYDDDTTLFTVIGNVLALPLVNVIVASLIEAVTRASALEAVAETVKSNVDPSPLVNVKVSVKTEPVIINEPVLMVVPAFNAYEAVTAYEELIALSAFNACDADVEVNAYDAEITVPAVVAYEAVTVRLDIELPLPSVRMSLDEPLIWTNPS